MRRHARSIALVIGVAVAADGVRLADRAHHELPLLVVGLLVVGAAIAGERVTEVILSRSKDGGYAIALKLRAEVAGALTKLSEGEVDEAENALRGIIWQPEALRAGMMTSAISFYELQQDGTRLLHVTAPGLREGERLVCSVSDPGGVPHLSEPLLGRDGGTVRFPNDFPTLGDPRAGYYLWQWYGAGDLGVRRELPNTAGGFVHGSTVSPVNG